MTDTTVLEAIVERVLNGRPLAPEERAVLFGARDLLALGMAADDVRRRRHGSRFTFVRVAHLNLASAATGQVAWTGSPGELRLDGVFGDLRLARAAVRHAAAAAGGHMPVTGFSLADIETASGQDSVQIESALRELRAAGLSAVAEAPVDRLVDADAMLRACDTAGVPVLRLTVERVRAEDRAPLLSQAAMLVSAHPDVRAFAPLARRVAGATPSTGYEDVHLVALARLLVPVHHIQVDWTLYGPKLAQVALTFGADDVDDVSTVEDVVEGRRRAPLEEIRRNIHAASGEPVERDALFAVRR